MTQTLRQKPAYFGQLDGLRAFAFLGVFFDHLAFAHYTFERDFGFSLPTVLGGKEVRFHFNLYTFTLGTTGVDLFFVLSGFLIGNILLTQKLSMHNSGASIKSILTNFYIRRTLRIFPVYYLLIFFFMLIGFPDFIYETAPWFLTYSFNIGQYAYLPLKSFWPLSPFWTLACEEQFYLIFPPILMFTPIKRIPLIFAGLFVFAYLFGYLMVHFGNGVEGLVSNLGPSTFDRFSLGILLAYLRLKGVKIPKSQLFMWVFLGLYALVALWSGYIPGKPYLQFFFLSVGFFFLINNAVDGYKGIAGKLLTWQPLVYIGKISYGLYLFHSTVPYLRDRIFSLAGLGYSNKPLLIISDFILVMLIASLSFRFIETPFNNLKNRFKYNESDAKLS